MKQLWLRVLLRDTRVETGQDTQQYASFGTGSSEERAPTTNARIVHRTTYEHNTVMTFHVSCLYVSHALMQVCNQDWCIGSWAYLAVGHSLQLGIMSI